MTAAGPIRSSKRQGTNRLVRRRQRHLSRGSRGAVRELERVLRVRARRRPVAHHPSFYGRSQRKQRHLRGR